MATAKNTQHSNYWLNDDLFEDDNDVSLLGDDDDSSSEETSVDLGRLIRLAAIRRGIGNFVQILTNKNIPVEFSSGKESYTDGKSVVIAADSDPKKFDPMVGLALHEASHVLLSDFGFLRLFQSVRQDHAMGMAPTRVNYYDANNLYINLQRNVADTKAGISITEAMLHPTLAAVVQSMKEKGPEYHQYVVRMLDDIKDIMNILEDRRIDKYVYNTAVGYRPYYEALYNKYFFTKENANNLKFNPEWREATVENYINRLLLFFHPAAQEDAIPGLKNLIQMMDIDSIERVGNHDDKYQTSYQYADLPVLWQDANLLYAYILKYAKLNAQRKQQEGGEGGDPFADNLPDSLLGLPNLDGGPETPDDMKPTDVETAKGKPGKFNPKTAARDLNKARSIMNGQHKKKKIKKAEQDTISSMDEAKAELVDIKGDGVPWGNALVIRKITESVLDSEWFPFGTRWAHATYQKAIAAGRRMGAILEHRLQVRNDPQLTKQTRLPKGGLDRRLLAQLGMDITSVFQKTQVDTYSPVLLHLSLDASGSMTGKKWEKVLTVATALAYIGSRMRNVDTVISLRGGNTMPVVAIAFDSRTDNFKNYLKIMGRISPVCSTPEGLCYKATMDLILESTKTHQVYFINFSDGEPCFSYSKRNTLIAGGENEYFSYGGEVAVEHTRKMVNTMREHGIKIMSYFITDSYGGSSVWNPYGGQNALNLFKRMYGADSENVNVENATEVLRTLNKLLLNRAA